MGNSIHWGGLGSFRTNTVEGSDCVERFGGDKRGEGSVCVKCEDAGNEGG